MKLEYSYTDGMGWITLSASPHGSPEGSASADPAELARFLATPHMPAAILTGKGRHFWQGTDPDATRAQTGDSAQLGPAPAPDPSLLEQIAFAPIPVLAMIRGDCLDAGLEIALGCHFRFAAEKARLGFPALRRTPLPGVAGTVFGGDVLSRRNAVDLLVSGRCIRGAEAFAMGLVDRVAAAVDLRRAATDYVRGLTAGRSVEQIRAIMQAIDHGRRLETEEALRREAGLFLGLARNVRNRKP